MSIAFPLCLCRFPIIFHAVIGEDAREGNSPSWFNVLEAKLVLEYVLKLKAKRGGQQVVDADIGKRSLASL